MARKTKAPVDYQTGTPQVGDGVIWNGHEWVLVKIHLWEETRPKGDVNGYWHNNNAISKDGSKLFISGDWGQATGKPYFYNGTSWAEDLPVAGWNIRTVSAMNGKGDVFIVAGFGGRLYIKKSGVWTEHKPAGDMNKNWFTVAVNKGT